MRRIRSSVPFWLMVLIASTLIGLVAPPAAAQSSAEVIGLGPGASVTGTHNGASRTLSAVLIKIKIDDATEAWAYCIDIEHSLPGAGVDLDEIDWSDAHVSNPVALGKINWILQNYPADETATETNSVEAAAVQAAIWHFSDGFNLTSAAGGQAVLDLYQTIISSAVSLPQPDPSISITPDTKGGMAGDYLEFVVASNSTQAVQLTLEGAGAAGAQIVTCDAAHTSISSLSPPFPKSVCLRKDTAANVTVRATTTTTLEAGRVFSAPGFQQIILADDVTSTVSDTATAIWHASNALTVSLQCPSPFVEGQPATWTASASDSDTLTYHWFVDGVARPPTASNTLTLPAVRNQVISVSVSDGGNFSSGAPVVGDCLMTSVRGVTLDRPAPVVPVAAVAPQVLGAQTERVQGGNLARTGRSLGFIAAGGFLLAMLGWTLRLAFLRRRHYDVT